MRKFFPRVRSTKFTCDSGVNLVATIVNDELGWLFRENPGDMDFGIDGYIDVVAEDGAVTGRSFAVQIKAGRSFFKSKTSNGFTYYGDNKHFDYYRNHQMPVLLVICDTSKKVCLYALFDELSTEPTPAGWKLDIRSKNRFGQETKQALLDLLPPLTEGSAALNKLWVENEKFKSTDVILYVVGREDIENGNVNYFKDFIKRLCVNDDLCRKVQGKLEVMIDGYNNDARELFEISAVKKWYVKADKLEIPWFRKEWGQIYFSKEWGQIYFSS